MKIIVCVKQVPDTTTRIRVGPDGRSIAYVQVAGELFEKRELQVAGQEKGLMLVSAGIAAGERIVTGAAYHVRLASLSTGVPAHGHEH